MCLCVEKSAVLSKSHGTHSLVVLECKGSGALDVYEDSRSKLETCRFGEESRSVNKVNPPVNDFPNALMYMYIVVVASPIHTSNYSILQSIM